MFQRRHSFTTNFIDDFYTFRLLYVPEYLTKDNKISFWRALSNFFEHSVSRFSNQRQQLVAKISFAIDQKSFGNFDDKLTQHSIEICCADVDNKGKSWHIIFCCYSCALIVFDWMKSLSSHSLKNLIHEKLL